jgi:glycosyltransferase involved in cell wall biosynthesis
MTRRVLMVAYHFPPVHGSSGLQRTLKFSRYLPQFGWQPIVLTVHPRAYTETTTGQLVDIGKETVVARAFALDTARHLAVAGRYPGWFAIPDRWVSWWFAAVPAGLRLIRLYRPAAIWSTYPIATAHLIGYSLHRLSRLPWIADFRDSMTEENYPKDPLVHRAYSAIERRAVNRSARAVFTTPGAVRMYAGRYPNVPSTRWGMIPNGYDEENFTDAEKALGERSRSGPLVLVHSGLLYPSERDPTAFFGALQALKRKGRIAAGGVKVILRATGHDAHYRPMLAQRDLADIVFLEPAISYREALAEMLRADGLLVFQAANCNHQIPAKIYEYLRARRPIMALTDAAGDTAAVLRTAGIDTIAPLDSAAAIETGLLAFFERLRTGTAPVANDAEIARHSRLAGAQELAHLLDAVK